MQRSQRSAGREMEAGFAILKKIPSKCPVMQSKYEPELDDRIDKTLVMDSVKKLVTGFMFVQRTVEYLYRLQA